MEMVRYTFRVRTRFSVRVEVRYRVVLRQGL